MSLYNTLFTKCYIILKIRKLLGIFTYIVIKWKKTFWISEHLRFYKKFNQKMNPQSYLEESRSGPSADTMEWTRRLFVNVSISITEMVKCFS